MEKTSAAFTIFTFFLFAVSTARISLQSPAAYLPVVQSSDDASKSIKALPEPADIAEDSNIILPTDKLKSKDDETDHARETSKSRMFRVDLTPRADFARFHAINRHFYDEPRIPLRFGHRHHRVNPFLIPRSRISREKEVILSGEASNADLGRVRRKSPLKRMKLTHDSGHRHHRNQQHHLHHGNNKASTPKRKFGREKPKSFVHQHKEKMRENETGFMKNIRKFLKHTFD